MIIHDHDRKHSLHFTSIIIILMGLQSIVMKNSFDLNLVPLVRSAGREYPEFIGLFATKAPRRSARGRSSDRLILYLNMLGNAPLAPGKQRQVLSELADLYFATPGSITTAMRTVASRLNQILLERNKTLAVSSRQSMGTLGQIVVRENRLFIAQSGSIHIFLIKENEALEFHDTDIAEGFLGQSRKTPIFYFQENINVHDSLIIASQPSLDWNSSSLRDLHGQGPESLRRRLIGRNLDDIHAVLAHATTGKGEIFLPSVAAYEKTKAQKRDLKKLSRKDEPSKTEEIKKDKDTHTDPIILPAPEKEIEDQPKEQSAVSLSIAAQLKQKEEAEEAQREPKEISEEKVDLDSEQPKLPQITRQPSKFKLSIQAILQSITDFLKKVFGRFGALMMKLVPNEDFFSIPSPIMALIAIAVPVIIVTAASITYFHLGIDAQYESLYKKSEEMALKAIHQEDLQQKRAELEATLRFLDQAEDYRQDTPEVKSLRNEITSMLDGLDMIVRVNYQPAIVDGLPIEVNIAQIVSSKDDLFILDAASGDVLRAELQGNVYQLDDDFQCGQSSSEAVQIGAIVDINTWSPGFKPDADIIAVDSSGNLLYCKANEPAQLTRLTPPESLSLENISSSWLDLGNFYVLDISTNNTWIYWRSDFDEIPSAFSNSPIPNLNDVIDMTVNRDELYLLHETGSISLCFLQDIDESPTQCSEVPYIDYRPGKENLPFTPPSPFTHMQYTSPPDPSLFLLEPKDHTIYHFSLRNLAYQTKYLPIEDHFLDQASAFFVDNLRRYLFIGIGNQVYHALMP